MYSVDVSFETFLDSLDNANRLVESLSMRGQEVEKRAPKSGSVR